MSLFQSMEGKKTYTLAGIELIPFVLGLFQDPNMNALLQSLFGDHYQIVSLVLSILTGIISKLTKRA